MKSGAQRGRGQASKHGRRELLELRATLGENTLRGDTGGFSALRALGEDEESTGTGLARGGPRRPIRTDWCRCCADRALRLRIRLVGLETRTGARATPARPGRLSGAACGVVVDPPTLDDRRKGTPCGIPDAGNRGRSGGCLWVPLPSQELMPCTRLGLGDRCKATQPSNRKQISGQWLCG
ncbi:hypothetical protein NDU88_003901 [Pleurodeles waltl]|uniref:Uncharacterized protein n=1 Tax=Pleurodeles waltl TaxID=8319 RepID=A0AAV7M8B9_PLEWA|nr:hypothetical protein NDU88_003901 [Pleurodeles waltl]